MEPNHINGVSGSQADLFLSRMEGRGQDTLTTCSVLDLPCASRTFLLNETPESPHTISLQPHAPTRHSHKLNLGLVALFNGMLR